MRCRRFRRRTGRSTIEKKIRIRKKRICRKAAYPFFEGRESEEIINEISGTGKLSDHISSP